MITEHDRKAAGKKSEKTNALFIMCDDLNCGLACYGHPQMKTPNIDRFTARENGTMSARRAPAS